MIGYGMLCGKEIKLSTTLCEDAEGKNYLIMCIECLERTPLMVGVNENGEAYELVEQLIDE